MDIVTCRAKLEHGVGHDRVGILGPAVVVDAMAFDVDHPITHGSRPLGGVARAGVSSGCTRLSPASRRAPCPPRADGARPVSGHSAARPIYARNSLGVTSHGSSAPWSLTSCWASNAATGRSEEHTSELQSHLNLVCRLLLE